VEKTSRNTDEHGCRFAAARMDADFFFIRVHPCCGWFCPRTLTVTQNKQGATLPVAPRLFGLINRIR
jgi:hypothetical protein